MTNNIKKDTVVKRNQKSLEFMTKMMLLKNSKTTGYTDSIHFYRKNVSDTSR